MLLKEQCLAAYNNKNGAESLQKSLGDVQMPDGQRIAPYRGGWLTRVEKRAKISVANKGKPRKSKRKTVKRSEVKKCEEDAANISDPDSSEPPSDQSDDDFQPQYLVNL